LNIVKQWMRAATPDEQKVMAEALGTSRQMLYQISGEHATVSAERAVRMEHQATAMHKASKGRLPRIYRTDLCEACRACEFAQRCLGAAAVRADFPIVTADMVAAGATTDSEGGDHD